MWSSDACSRAHDLVLTCRAWRPGPSAGPESGTERDRGTVAALGTQVQLHTELTSTGVCTASVAGSTEYSNMGLQGRDGQNGYLPDASTSSYDVAAMPSDTSYDRDPEARATIAPHRHSHNSEVSCGNTFAGAAECMCVLALRSLCPDACPPTSVPVSAWPLCRHCVLCSNVALLCGRAIALLPLQCNTSAQTWCRSGTLWWWGLASLAARLPSHRARCSPPERF